MMGGPIILLLFVGFIAFVVWYLRAFAEDRRARQAGAEENVKRNGGRRVLEWSGNTATGPADTEFGELVAEIPAKRGESAKFYRTGCVIGTKRVDYLNVKDILVEGAEGSGRGARDAAKVWIYRHKGGTIGLNSLSYQIDSHTAETIKQGLGF